MRYFKPPKRKDGKIYHGKILCMNDDLTMAMWDTTDKRKFQDISSDEKEAKALEKYTELNKEDAFLEMI